MTKKTVSVSFHTIEPGASSPFVAGAFPRDAFLEILRKLDPADDGNKVNRTMLGGQDFCHLREDGKMPLLIGFFKDTAWTPLQERKGEVTEVPLEPDAGIVDPSYVMFFPGDVVGILQSSRRAPGPARISSVLAHVTKVDFYFQRLRMASVLDQLHGGGLLRRFEAILPKSEIARLRRAARKDVGLVAAFDAASKAVNASSESILIAASAQAGPTASTWSSEVESELLGLLESDVLFDRLKVWVKGKRKAIDLTLAYVSWSEEIEVPGRKLSDKDGADLLVRAHGETSSVIAESSKRHRTERQ